MREPWRQPHGDRLAQYSVPLGQQLPDGELGLADVLAADTLDKDQGRCQVGGAGPTVAACQA